MSCVTDTTPGLGPTTQGHRPHGAPRSHAHSHTARAERGPNTNPQPLTTYPTQPYLTTLSSPPPAMASLLTRHLIDHLAPIGQPRLTQVGRHRQAHRIEMAAPLLVRRHPSDKPTKLLPRVARQQHPAPDVAPRANSLSSRAHTEYARATSAASAVAGGCARPRNATLLSCPGRLYELV